MPPKGSKIAQPRGEPTWEKTPEYEEFIKKLREFHEKRGYALQYTPGEDCAKQLQDLGRLRFRAKGQL